MTASYTVGLRNAVRALDEAIEWAFVPLRGRRGVDWVFYVASEAADYSKAWHTIGVTMALLSPSRRRHALRLAAALGLESIIVNGILKNLTKRERPPMLDNRVHEVRRPSTKSFPSGHASSAALSAVLLSDAIPRARPLWLTMAAIVAASRVHNRMHHGSDVAAGAILGTVFGLQAKRLWPLR